MQKESLRLHRILSINTPASLVDTFESIEASLIDAFEMLSTRGIISYVDVGWPVEIRQFAFQEAAELAVEHWKAHKPLALRMSFQDFRMDMPTSVLLAFKFAAVSWLDVVIRNLRQTETDANSSVSRLLAWGIYDMISDSIRDRFIGRASRVYSHMQFSSLANKYAGNSATTILTPTLLEEFFTAVESALDETANSTTFKEIPYDSINDFITECNKRLEDRLNIQDRDSLVEPFGLDWHAWRRL